MGSRSLKEASKGCEQVSLILRDYQIELLNAVRHEFGPNKKRRVILYAPTGSGKTEIGMEVIRGARDKGRNVMFVCNRLELIGQASRRFHAANIDHGVIQGDNTFGTYKPVLIASIQTLARRGYPENVGLIVIDEAHGVAGSKEYRKLLSTIKCPVLGLSATPISKGLGKHYEELGGPLFETIANTISIQGLIDLGYLVDVDIYAPSEPDLSQVKIVAGDYNEKQLGEAVDKPTLIGDIVEHWKKLSGYKRTVCFATNIAHSKHIVEQFTAAGISAAHIDCYTDDAERRRILKKLDNGELTIVSNVGVLCEGWDCPSVEVMILARPTRSLIRYIQMAGRVLRPCAGKVKALILDHSGSCKLLGFPTDDLPLQLDDGKPRKAAQRTEDSTDPLPKECVSCHYMKPPKVHACPKCGFAPQHRCDIEQHDGNLKKLERKKGKLTTTEKENIYAQFLWYARFKGYKEGWAYHKLKMYCGTYPARKVAPVEPSQETWKWLQSQNIRDAKRRQKDAHV